MDEGSYTIIGKVIYGGLDAEGHVHLILKNSAPAWAELAARFLKSLEGNVVRVEVSAWDGSRGGRQRRRFKAYAHRK
ncbi:MAG: hypothetical protein QXT50_00955 [Thermofilum sp.]